MAEKLSTQEDAAMETSNPSEFQNIIENPGLQNIVERIFLNLNYENLLTCRLINKSTRFILDKLIRQPIVLVEKVEDSRYSFWDIFNWVF